MTDIKAADWISLNFEPLVNHYMKQTETQTKYRKHSYYTLIKY